MKSNLQQYPPTVRLRTAGGKIATGNRLRDGTVVYLNRAGAGATEVAEARVLTPPRKRLL